MSEDYYKEIEEILRNILKPIPKIKFSTFVRLLSGHKIIPLDKEKDKDLLNLLQKIGYEVKKLVEETDGIVKFAKQKEQKRPIRPNEAGNYLEDYVREVLNKYGQADTPLTVSGKKKSVGYPDIIFLYKGRILYIEVKTYNPKNKQSSLRAFYAFPPDDEGGIKIISDGYHILLAFGLYKREARFFISEYTVVDLSKLEGRIKREFNASNRDLYKKTL